MVLSMERSRKTATFGSLFQVFTRQSIYSTLEALVHKVIRLIKRKLHILQYYRVFKIIFPAFAFYV